MADSKEAGALRLSRRSFLGKAAGGVAISITGVSLLGINAAKAAVPQPGVASQRIDGLAKITGQKIFARDFRARDMDGWPGHEWHAIFVRAIRTDASFDGVDLTGLPSAAQPTRLVLGDALIPPGQDDDPDGTFNRPKGVLVHDLIVVPGKAPDFLGQAVALLLYDSLTGYRAARAALEFDDAQIQRYTPLGTQPPQHGTPLFPQTTYVKYDNDFSYAQASSDAAYMQHVPDWRTRINATLAGDTALIQQTFDVDMRAMDPMFMEPETGIVWAETATGTLNILLGTQSPDGDVKHLIEMFQSPGSPLDLTAINMTTCYPGGGFGGRDSSPFTLMLAVAAAFAEGNPVRVAYDRFEQFRVGLKRHAATVQGTLSADPDMSLRAVQMQMAFDSGGRKNLSPYVASLAALCAGGSYDLPMADIYSAAYHSENISGGSQRGFGGPQAFFAIETALDDLAHGQNWDPIALRRANLIEEGHRTVAGGPVGQSLRLAEMLDIAEAHPLWSDRSAIKAAHEADGRLYGTGFAMSLQAYGTSGDGLVAAVQLNIDGSLTVQSNAIDMGNGSATTLEVVIGPILGSNAKTVEMGDYHLFGQTGLTDDPNAGRWDNPRWTANATMSSSACLTGLHQVHVVQQAATALFQGSLLVAAAEIWQTGPLTQAQVAWQDGRLDYLPGGKIPIPLSVFAKAVRTMGLPHGALGHAYFQDSWAEADYPTPGGSLHLQLDGLSYFQNDAPTPVFVERQNTTGPDAATKRYSRYVWAPCVNVVGLSLSPQTGIVQVENLLSVLNAGYLHVPELVSGQSQGGVAMGLSYTLLEDLPPGMDGPANGEWNLNRYHVARAQDVPLGDRYIPGGRAQELICLDPDPAEAEHRTGRGIAEAVMCSVPPAISNALRDATGRRFASLPITPEKILKGLKT